MCRRRLNIHAQAACVVEQTWIPHKRCSIGEDKPRLRSDEATKPGQKIYIWGLIPLKAGRERVSVTTPHGQECWTVTPCTADGDIATLKIMARA